MSTLWTPGGERPVPREEATTNPEDEHGPLPGDEPDDEEMAARMAELRDQLARTPAAMVVANHAYGLFELAALHLSLDPPQLAEAQLAIDALGALVQGVSGRLGEAEEHLQDGLSQLRLAFVQVKASLEEPPPAG